MTRASSDGQWDRNVLTQPRLGPRARDGSFLGFS